jgi:ABC-type multidrug transport system, ATPase and permease components
VKNKKIDFKKIYEFIKPEWFFIVVSLVCGLFFVLFNSLSIWLTASLINNVLMDFDTLLLEQSILLNRESITVNQKLKIIFNNLILRDSYLETLKVLCFAIIFIFILKNIFLYLKNLSMSYVQLRIVTQFRNRLYAHLQKMSLAFFYRKRSGDLSSIIMNDVGALRQSIGVAFQKIIVEPINIFTIAILLFIISWKINVNCFY